MIKICFFFCMSKVDRKKQKNIPSPRNNQITPQHPLLSPRNLHPLMNHTMITMSMQKRHPHLRRNSYRLRPSILPRSLRIKYRFPTRTRSQINKQRPSRPTSNRLRLRLRRSRRKCYIICLIVCKPVSDSSLFYDFSNADLQCCPKNCPAEYR